MDSIFLLQQMHEAGFHVLAAHFNHMIRPEAQMDADFVHDYCKTFNIDFEEGSEDVPAYARANRLSLEEAARISRYHFLFRTAAVRKCQAVCTAHHADDQVETVLMHFLRGAGSFGLAGMQPIQLPNEWSETIPLMRPLLNISRAEIEKKCKEMAIPSVEDKTNSDPAFLRNRIRTELIPLLEKNYNPAIRSTLNRNALAFQMDADLIGQAVNECWDRLIDRDHSHSKAIALKRSAFQSLSQAMRIAVLRKAAFTLRPAARDFGLEAYLRGDDFFCNAMAGGKMDFPHKLTLQVRERSLMIRLQDYDPAAGLYPQLPHREFQLTLPAGGTIFAGEWLFSVEVLEGSAEPTDRLIETMKNDPNTVYLDHTRLQFPLTLRTAELGERFCPNGMNGKHIKMSDYWVNRKLPQSQRACYPVIADQDQIVWLPGFQAAEKGTISTKSTALVKITIDKNKSGSGQDTSKSASK